MQHYFIKLTDCSLGSLDHRDAAPEQLHDSWVRVTDIVDICQAGDRHEILVHLTKEEYDNRDPNGRYRTWGDTGFGQYVPTVILFLRHFDRDVPSAHSHTHTGAVRTTGHVDDVVKLVAAAERAARVDEALAIDAARVALKHPNRIIDRGAWVSGQDYEPLDYVTDAGQGYLCQAANTSTSSAVLQNTTYWCKFTLPAAA